MQITIPDWLLPIGYGAIGCYVGLRFDRPTVQYVWRRLPMMILASLLLIVLCALSAWLIAVMMDKDYLSVYLATAQVGWTRWQSSPSIPTRRRLRAGHADLALVRCDPDRQLSGTADHSSD